MLNTKSSYEMCYDRIFPIKISTYVWNMMKKYDKWLNKNIHNNTFFIIDKGDRYDRPNNWKKVKKIDNYTIYSVSYTNIKVSPFCKDCSINETCAIACFDDTYVDDCGVRQPIDFKRIREFHLSNISTNLIGYIVESWKEDERGKFVYNGEDLNDGFEIFFTKKDAIDGIKLILKNELNSLKERIEELEALDIKIN